MNHHTARRLYWVSLAACAGLAWYCAWILARIWSL